MAKHVYSARLRNTGHNHVADELDRLLTALENLHNEAGTNNGHVSKATHYNAAALIASRRADPSEAAA